MAKSKQNGLHHHITAVKKGERAFENAFQAVSRMILEKKIDKVIVNGDHDGDSYIVALDRATGETVWKQPRPNKTRSYCVPIIREIDDPEPKPTFDGHATCFICSGYEKAFLIDFNYEYEPLPGKFPFPGLGPFSLLGDSYMNYWGKMMFKWVYWNVLLAGRAMPIPALMSMAGKIREEVK